MFSGCTVPPDIVRRPNFEVATKRLLHQQVKYWGSFSALFAHGSASLHLCPVVWILLRSLISFVKTDEFSVRVTKITSRIGVS